MSISTRKALDSDRQRCIWIESGAIPGYAYIDDVWDLFTKNNDGELTLALEDGVAGGMGKLTHLFGPYCWLEVLRVHPDFQNKGLGKAIYRRYFEQMAERKLTACGMYTGQDNTHSRHLAELFGLTLGGRFSEYILPREGAKCDEPHGFRLVPEAEGEGLLAPHYGSMPGFISVNRTWYPAKEGLGRHMAQRGWLFADDGGSIAIVGGRFQLFKNIYLPFFAGDFNKILGFAAAAGQRQGSANISAMIAYNDDKKADLLKKHGFLKPAKDLITLWKGL